MEDLIVAMIGGLIAGGPPAIIIGLILFIILLVFDRKRILRDIEKKDELIAKKDDKIDKIIDEYYKGNMTLADALNQLRNVLFDIKSRLL